MRLLPITSEPVLSMVACPPVAMLAKSEIPVDAGNVGPAVGLLLVIGFLLLLFVVVGMSVVMRALRRSRERTGKSTQGKTRVDDVWAMHKPPPVNWPASEAGLDERRNGDDDQ